MFLSSKALMVLHRTTQNLRLAVERGTSFCNSQALAAQGGRLRANLSSRFHGKSSKHAPELILGIESSCDDTGVALIQASDGSILGHAIANQVDIHAPWGGVVPTLASEAHRSAIDQTVQLVLQQAQLQVKDLDAVAVTIGPGLSLCLKVGVLKAINMAVDHDLEYVPVHHMEAHALIARQAASVPFPFLCLLVSGGHNMILLAHGVGNYTLLGSTLDDAVGEAFDKAARLLGLQMKPNGGAALEQLALGGDPHAFHFSAPLKKYSDCSFSYAGLKTAVRLAVEHQVPEGPSESNQQVRADIAASFQRVAVDHLVERCKRAIQWAQADWPEVQHLVVSGGVAANRSLRQQLTCISEAANLHLVCPPPALCTDNGIMVAWAGLERLRAGYQEYTPAVPATDEEHYVDVRPRWPLTDRVHPKMRTAQRSQRKSRIFPSLTEITLGNQALAATIRG